MSTSAVVPFIDAHTHLHTRSFDDWETLGMTGMAAAILSTGNPTAYREIHEEAPDWAEVRRYWDMPIRLAAGAEKVHFFKVFVAVGLSMMARVREWKKAIELLPEYLRKPHVVAIGETGLDPIQQTRGLGWPLEDQKAAFAEEVRVAKELDAPLMLHTPTPKQKDRYHAGGLAFAEMLSEVPPERHRRYFLDLDMEIINRVGLNHRRLLIDHADETILEYALRETDAYVCIRVGIRLPGETNPYFFADVVEGYGPERLMISTDHGARNPIDLLAIPRTIREMRRRGIDEQSIRRVVFDNANEFFGLGLEG